MSNNIDLKKGLDIPIKGAAAQTVKTKVVPDTVALKPTDFRGLVPRLLVREGDRVLAGSPLFADKLHPEILFTAPVSGTVTGIVRGDKRKLLAVRIQADATQEHVDFGKHKATSLNRAEVKDLLLKSGLWGALIQRPYGVLADPSVTPKSIFVSAFDTAPLAADPEYALGDQLEYVQAGLTALAKLTDGGLHFCLNSANYSSTPFHKVEDVIPHTVSGRHPAGNVGVQISHISPIRKGETVWTASLLMVAAIGRLIVTGRLDLSRKVAVTGPAAVEPAYVQAFPGMPVSAIATDFGITDDTRVISGNVLTGETIGRNGYLGFFDNQLTLIKEGTRKELLGWANPIRSKLYSASGCYLSWLTPKKRYDMDTNLHGGPRAFVETKCFQDVTPIDIFPIYLIKACLAGDIDKMEQFGIYEVLPEDLALCDYVDPSKNDIQAIIREGIDRMIQEMA